MRKYNGKAFPVREFAMEEEAKNWLFPPKPKEE